MLIIKEELSENWG